MDAAYVQADILFVVDVATVRQATDVIGLLLFIARILCTCSSFTGRLVWRYKLVNLAVPRRDFEAALKSATKTTAGAGLPPPENELELSRCTDLQSLRHWLYLLLNTECLGLCKKQSGAAYQADRTPSSIWRSVEKYLHDVDLSWFANRELKGSPISSPSSARPDSARYVIIASEIPDCLPRYRHSAGATRERLMHSGDVESSTDLVSAQLTASTLSKLSGAGFKLFWGGTGGAQARQPEVIAGIPLVKLHYKLTLGLPKDIVSSTCGLICAKIIIGANTGSEVRNALRGLLGDSPLCSVEVPFPPAHMDAGVFAQKLDVLLADGGRDWRNVMNGSPDYSHFAADGCFPTNEVGAEEVFTRGKVAKRVPAPLLGLMNKDAISPSSLELDSTTCDQPVHVPAGHHPTSLKSDASQPSLRDILLRPSSVPKPTPLRPLSPSKHFLSTKGGSLAARVLSQPGANLPASVTPGRKPAAPTVHVQGSTAAQQSGNFSGETWQVHNSSLAETDTDVAELQYTARTSASTQRVARLSPLTTMRDNPLSDSQEDERCPVQLVAAAAVQSIAANHPHRITRASSAAAASSACAVHADAVCAAVPKKSTPAKPGSGTDSAPLAAAVESGASIKAGNGCGPTAAAAGEQPRGHAAKARSTHAGVPAEGAAVAEAIAPVKRKRGRPPKAPAAPEQTSEGASTAQPSSTRHVTANVPAVSKVKKPRLPKATANDKAEDIAAVKVSSTAQEPRDVAAVKPRRGKAAKAAAVEEVPGHTGSAQLSTVPGVLPVTAAVPKPKRGRPRKVITDIEHSSGDLTAGRLGSTSQVAEDAAPIKPRRGRPPKAPAAADHFPKTVAAVKPGGDIVHAAAECVAVPKVRRGQPSKASATRDAAAVKPNSNIHAATDASDVPKAKCNCPPKVSAASEQTSSNTAPPAAPPLPVPKPKQRRAPQAAAAASEPDSGNTTQPSSSTHIRSTAQPKVAKGGIARVTATILTRGSRPQAPSAPQAADSSTSSAKMSCGDQATLAAASSAETSLSATAPRQDPSGTSSAVPEAAGGSDPLQVLAMAAAAASSSPPQQSRPQPFTFKATSSSHGTAARGFDEATFVTVFKQLEKVEAASAAELQVLRACLVLCYKDAKKHDFTLQLKGGPKLRSIRKLIVDWQQRKKELMANCGSMRGLLGKRHHHAQEDGLAPAKRHRKAASSTPASSAPVQDVPRDEPSNMAGLEDDEVMAVEAMGLLSAEKAPVAAAMPKQAWASTAGHHAEEIVSCTDHMPGLVVVPRTQTARQQQAADSAQAHNRLSLAQPAFTFAAASAEVTGRVFDKDVFAILCKHLQSEVQATAAELQVLKAYLVLCYKDAKTRRLVFQLRDGSRCRSIKSFLVDWQERKQALMGNSEPMHHLLGKRGRSSGDDQRPGKRHRKAASSALRQDESSGEASNVAGSEEKDIEAAEAIQLLSADKVPVAAAVAKKASATAAGHQAEEANAPSCDKPYPVVESGNGNAQQQQPAPAAPVVRRSSRPHKVTAVAQESAEQAASHQQPRKRRQATVDRAADKEPEQRDAVTSTSVHPKEHNGRAGRGSRTGNTAKSKKAGGAASSATSTAAAGSDRTVTTSSCSGAIVRFQLEIQEKVAVGRFSDSRASGRLPGQCAYQNAGRYVRVYRPSRLQLQAPRALHQPDAHGSYMQAGHKRKPNRSVKPAADPEPDEQAGRKRTFDRSVKLAAVPEPDIVPTVESQPMGRGHRIRRATDAPKGSDQQVMFDKAVLASKKAAAAPAGANAQRAPKEARPAFPDETGSQSGAAPEAVKRKQGARNDSPNPKRARSALPDEADC